MGNRKNNGIRNIGAGILNSFILSILPFITRTIIVITIGSRYLGLSSLFTSILMVLNLSELGFGSALVFSMYKPIADDNKKQICALLNLYKKIYWFIGTGILIMGLIFAPFLPVIIKGKWPADINIYILYFIYLFNAAISYFAFAHKKALLTAYQRNDMISNVNSIVTIITYIVQIILLLTIRNYYLYVCIFPIFTVIENICTAIITKKKYPDLICIGYVSTEDKKKIKDHVKGIALQKICSTSRNSFDSIAVSMFLGLVSIAIYNNYYYIMSAIHAFLYQIPNAIRASVGNSVACETVEKNYNDFNIMNFLYVWVVGWCTVCLLCLYQPFMQLWMGKDMMLPLRTVILFCIYFFELSMGNIVSLYKDTAGLWWYGRYRTGIEALANLLLNFLLGWLFKIDGILIATIVTVTFIGLGYGGYIVFRYYFTKENFGMYIISQLLYLGIAAVVSAITLMICYLVPETGIMGLIIRALICIPIPNVLFWILLRKHKYYESSKEFAFNILKTFLGKKLIEYKL